MDEPPCTHAKNMRSVSRKESERKRPELIYSCCPDIRLYVPRRITKGQRYDGVPFETGEDHFPDTKSASR
jgi:hypothetical protein